MDKRLSLSSTAFRQAAKELCSHHKDAPRAERFFKKSSARVATLVTPKSCELKLEGKKHRASIKERRQNPLTVRLSDIEREIVQTKAKTVGCSVNSYVKASVLGSHYRPPRDPELTRELLMANRELTRQGSNLNQIARHVNSGGNSAEAESMLGLIARSMLQTHKMLRRVLAQLAGGTAP